MTEPVTIPNAETAQNLDQNTGGFLTRIGELTKVSDVIAHAYPDGNASVELEEFGEILNDAKLMDQLLNKGGFTPIQDSIIGSFNIITKVNNKKAMEMYKKYVKSGGMQSTLLAVDKPNIFDGKVFDILNKGPIRNSDRGILAPFKALTRLSEEMTRFRIFEKTYKKAVEKG